MFIYNKKSDLFDYLSEREKIRADLLLDSVGAVDENRKNLILAVLPETGEFLGFAICSPNLVQSDSTSITMIAVKESFRKKGVFREIVKYIQSKFSHVSLTCKPELVSLYEKIGFNASGVFQTHICMNHGNESGPGKLISVDDEYVMRHPSVMKEYKKLVEKIGKIRVDSCIAKWQKDFSMAESEARNFYAGHAKKPT
ncbi:GNAT family N-acetyltransferase [Pseudomonas sp. sp1636]|uniref:GNAT family N-acetyltransferase n=1 Tax=Pseudomonas sp. sp1636 TaxID=3036707 RepID=UPI0025A5D77C|nr:GNAT family N-acetyltransferase [Pseudomonas sp. sp1636]MDM8350886.1 GNAT family N-acetyltransferase [Pseudomonas sp. sp1636]